MTKYTIVDRDDRLARHVGKVPLSLTKREFKRAAQRPRPNNSDKD